MAVFESYPNIYAASAPAIPVVASATDIFTITGSATKTISVIGIQISGIATAATALDVRIIKRSAADTGGTPVASTVVPLNALSAAGTATVNSYTANPGALGAAVGTIMSPRISIMTAASASVSPAYILFPSPVILNGIAQQLAVNLNAVTVTGGAISIDVIWNEM